MAYKISVCIPTYNRASYLEEAITSIIEQADPRVVEIVISDNASTDDTAKRVKALQKRYPSIHYHPSPVNRGMDLNIYRAVELAQGEYCWLCGDDDAFEPGAIGAMLEHLQDGHDIYICQRKNYEGHFDCPMYDEVWGELTAPATIHLNDEEEVMAYVDQANGLGALHGFLTTTLFKRSEWLRHAVCVSLLGTFYHHVYILWAFSKHRTTLRFIPDFLIKHRCFNDRILVGAPAERVNIDMEAYDTIATELFSPRVQRAFHRAIRREINKCYLLRLKYLYQIRLVSSSDSWRRLMHLNRRIAGRNYALYLPHLLGKRGSHCVLAVKRAIRRFIGKKVY